MGALPYRGTFGSPRPIALSSVPLPPEPMPSHRGGRPLKSWRYVGAYGEELMLCAGRVRIGRLRQSFWAVWDRAAGRLYERTALGRAGVELATGSLAINDRDLRLHLRLEETTGSESVCESGEHYAWTRKQGGVRAAGTIVLSGAQRRFEARGVIDDTAAYYERHTSWRWSAGVGLARDGRSLAWNLVSGVNDPPSASERTVWIEGEPFEHPPVSFTENLLGVGGLRFAPEATRVRRENLLLIRSAYSQPFGTFSGELPGAGPLAEGYGVMEVHDAVW